MNTLKGSTVYRVQCLRLFSGDVQLYTYIHVHVPACTCTCMYMYSMYAHRYSTGISHTSMYINVYMWVIGITYGSYMYTHTPDTHTHRHTHTHTYTHTHTHTNTYTHIHTHTYTHIHTLFPHSPSLFFSCHSFSLSLPLLINVQYLPMTTL